VNRSLRTFMSLVVWVAVPAVVHAADDNAAAIGSRGYVAGDLPTSSCHASTIAEPKPGESLVEG